MEFQDKTRIVLGCENCLARQELEFEQFPASVLFGTDTKGVPGRVESETIIKNANRAIWVRSYNFEQRVADCGPICERSQQLRDIAAYMLKHAQNNSKAN